MDSSLVAKLVVREGPSVGQTLALSRPETVIGRETTADFAIPSPSISRRHARIVSQGGYYILEDLGSSNGTFVNGQRISSPTPLYHGDRVQLGQNIVLHFDFPQPAEESQPAGTMVESPKTAAAQPEGTIVDFGGYDYAKSVAPSAYQLMVTVIGGPSKSYDLVKDQISLGRADDNDIFIPSRKVSRRHGLLVRQQDGSYQFTVLPEASNPVFMGGQPLSGPYNLQNGDELHIGQPGTELAVTLSYRAPAGAATRIGQPATSISTPSTPDISATEVVYHPLPSASAPPGSAETMAIKDFKLPTMSGPIQLEVIIAGSPAKSYTLTKPIITIGRAETNDIILNSKIVSRHHARLERIQDSYEVIALPEAGNPVLLEGRPVTEPRLLRHNDKLRIGSLDPGSMVTMNFIAPNQAVEATRQVQFGSKDVITIGRDASNDVVLDIPIVSRYHAQLERVGQRFRVRDLRSANGVFVNDQRIEEDAWLKPQDTIRIGPYRFLVGYDGLAQFDESSGLRVEAVSLNKWVRRNLNILQNISLVFQPREFVVVVGQSGGGKSTLVDSIAGYRPATDGSVTVNDINVYKNFDAIRNNIGFVPQRDIIHMELTVYQALDYAAQLRMPADTSKEERHKRILEVLDDLDLAHRKDVQISGLSGGQQKRVSIGVELLTKPGLFFLDEPTSGLDPGTETALMHLMRRLADQGRTIVLVTHATKNVMLADKVVFLARGGYLAWFGPPDEALAYFDQFRSERDRRAREMEFDEIYAILDDGSKGSPKDWGERYRNHSAYQQYVVQALAQKAATPVAVTPAEPQPKVKRARPAGNIRQFFILSSRNVKILTRDRFSLLLMLIAAPLVSLLDVILSLVLGRNPFDFFGGVIANVLITLFLPTVYGVMVGGLAQMREIVKEQDIYRRERLVNLRIIPYILSKVWVAALLALYQTACYLIVHYLAFDMPGGFVEFGLMYLSLALATMAGMMLGLFASAVAPNANAAPLIIILLMLPQIVLGGALVPLPEVVSAPTSTRWAFEAFMAITGPGADVAADACWQLPVEQRTLLTFEQKNESCRCMGIKALDGNSCLFPGLGEFRNEQLFNNPPQEPQLVEIVDPGQPPAEPGPRPADPTLPPQPVAPTDQTDLTAMAEYQRQIQDWQVQVQQVQDEYRAEVAIYEANISVYQAQLQDYQARLQANGEQQQKNAELNFAYQAELQAWQGQQQGQTQGAERLIGETVKNFGWTFVSKEDTTGYYGTLMTTWVAQSVIITILLFLTLIIQKRKDII